MMNHVEMQIENRWSSLQIKRVKRILEAQHPDRELISREIQLEKNIQNIQSYFKRGSNFSSIAELFERYNATSGDKAKKDSVKRHLQNELKKIYMKEIKFYITQVFKRVFVKRKPVSEVLMANQRITKTDEEWRNAEHQKAMRNVIRAISTGQDLQE